MRLKGVFRLEPQGGQVFFQMCGNRSKRFFAGERREENARLAVVGEKPEFCQARGNRFKPNGGLFNDPLNFFDFTASVSPKNFKVR